MHRNRMPTWVRGCLLAVAATAGLPLRSSGHDWPNWRGPHYDGISRETGLARSWPSNGPRVIWKAELTGGYSSVVVAGGKLFTQSKDKNEESVLCLSTANGKKLWEHRYPCDYSQHPTLDRRFLSGPRATPAVDGNRVYAIGSAGMLCCLDAGTGKPIWTKDLLAFAQRKCPEYGYCNSPLIVGDRLFLHPGGTKNASIAALDKMDGRVLWQALDDPLGWATPVPIRVKDQDQLVYFTATGGVGVAPETGKLLWRHAWKTDFDINAATPVYDNGLLFLSSNYGRGGTVVRLKEKGDPDVVWKSLVMQNHFSTSVLYQGHLYGFSTDRLRCVEFLTGKMKWDRTPGLGRGSLLIADGLIIALGDNGKLILVEATTEGYREKGRCQPLEGTTWNAPILSGGKLFIRGEKRILALDVMNAP